jgi:hypothetical protein
MENQQSSVHDLSGSRFHHLQASGVELDFTIGRGPE